MKSNGISTVRVRIEGVSPLLMHNAQLVDATNEWTLKIKALTSKHHSKKTDEDALELHRLEFMGGLYFDDDIGPYVPCVNVEGAIRDAARAKSKGKSVTAGVQVEPDKVPLIYDGPRNRDELYKGGFFDARVVKLKGAAVIRVRPRFERWGLEFVIMVFTDVINVSDVQWALSEAGRVKGLGDFRPKFGRFVVKEFSSRD